MTRSWLALAVALGALAAPAGAQIPAPPQLEGELGAGDPADSRGRRYDEYVIDARERQTLTITAAPAPGSSLDPVIEVYGPVGGAPLARDDDGGGGRDARVALASLSTGTYRVRVLGSSDAVGGYRLSIRGGMSGRRRLPRGSDDPNLGTDMPPPPAPPSLPRGLRPAPMSQGVGGISDGPLGAFIICPGHPRCPRR